MDETLQKKIEKENLLFPPCLVGGIEEDSYSLRRDSKSPSESVLFYFMPLWKEKKAFHDMMLKKTPASTKLSLVLLQLLLLSAVKTNFPTDTES